MFVYFILFSSIVSSFTIPFKTHSSSLLFSSKPKIDYSFKTLETEQHIVFMEYVLYTRIKEYRDKYMFSDSPKFTEILENMHKYILYPLNENDYYKVEEEENEFNGLNDGFKVEIEEEIEEEVEEGDDVGFNEFSMEKMYIY